MFKALSDPNRIRILKALQIRPLCVCELQQLLGIAQPSVSHHLRVLSDAGLVDFVRDGQWIDYKIAETESGSPAEVLLKNLEGWLAKDPKIIADRENLKYINREECKS